jgi:hypothetical protein
MDPVAGASQATASAAIASFESACGCEFNCREVSGVEIAVVVKVKMYREQLRSGGFQKEIEEVEMSLSEFKKHFLRCIHRYLVHHFHDIMSSQARRNLYKKMPVDPNLLTALIIASDYSAILDGHSQDQLNQTVQLHSILFSSLSYSRI